MRTKAPVPSQVAPHLSSPGCTRSCLGARHGLRAIRTLLTHSIPATQILAREDRLRDVSNKSSSCKQQVAGLGFEQTGQIQSLRPFAASNNAHFFLSEKKLIEIIHLTLFVKSNNTLSLIMKNCGLQPHLCLTSHPTPHPFSYLLWH